MHLLAEAGPEPVWVLGVEAPAPQTKVNALHCENVHAWKYERANGCSCVLFRAIASSWLLVVLSLVPSLRHVWSFCFFLVGRGLLKGFGRGSSAAGSVLILASKHDLGRRYGAARSSAVV